MSRKLVSTEERGIAVLNHRETETLAEALWSRTTHWNQQFKRHLDQRKVPDPFDADSFGGKAGLVGQPWPHLTILVYDKP